MAAGGRLRRCRRGHALMVKPSSPDGGCDLHQGSARQDCGTQQPLAEVKGAKTLICFDFRPWAGFESIAGCSSPSSTLPSSRLLRLLLGARRPARRSRASKPGAYCQSISVEKGCSFCSGVPPVGDYLHFLCADFAGWPRGRHPCSRPPCALPASPCLLASREVRRRLVE